MKKRDLGTLAAGMVLGAVLTGGAAAAGVMAEPSWQNIYVDGHQVHMTAYNIAGNNFIKLLTPERPRPKRLRPQRRRRSG